MSRPKDERGKLLPPPCHRLEEADKLRAAAVLAISKDGRAAFLTTARKIALADRVINHVVDGDAVPKAIYAKDKDDPDNHFMVDVWRTAEKAIRSELAR